MLVLCIFIALGYCLLKEVKVQIMVFSLLLVFTKLRKITCMALLFIRSEMLLGVPVCWVERYPNKTLHAGS